jgi:sec-independent protein translocase protein TatA
MLFKFNKNGTKIGFFCQHRFFCLSLHSDFINRKLISRNIMNTLLFFGNLGTGEIIIIALVVLLLFGGRKIPELMKGIGKGVKNFKDGVKGIEDDIKDDSTSDSKN